MSIVIVGAGLAGGTAATELREQGYEGRSCSSAPSSTRPTSARRCRRATCSATTRSTTPSCTRVEWYAEHDVDLRLGVEATAVDTDAHVVHTSTGGDVTYERLLLATGAEPRRLAVAEESGVPTAYLRTIEDSDRLKAAFADGGRIAVVGAGWIGLEVAAAARDGRVRGDRLRDRRPAPAAGARADRGAGVRRPAPRPRRRPAPGHAGERGGPGRRRPRRRGRRGHPTGRHWPRRPGSPSTTGCSWMPGCARRCRACSPSGTSPTTPTRCSAAGSGSSTGTPRSTRPRWPRTTSPAATRSTTRCPTSSPTSTTSAWSTSATPAPTTRSSCTGPRGAGVPGVLAARGPGRRGDARQRLGRHRRPARRGGLRGPPPGSLTPTHCEIPTREGPSGPLWGGYFAVSREGGLRGGGRRTRPRTRRPGRRRGARARAAPARRAGPPRPARPSTRGS